MAESERLLKIARCESMPNDQSLDWFEVTVIGGILAVCAPQRKDVEPTVIKALDSPFGGSKFGDIFNIRAYPGSISDAQIVDVGKERAGVWNNMGRATGNVVFLGTVVETPYQLSTKT